MPGCMTRQLHAIAVRGALAILILTGAAQSPALPAEPRPLSDALPLGRPSCHARTFGAAELAAHPQQRVTAIAFERIGRDLAIERKYGAVEQFDDTPVVVATLRVRLRGDPASHSARLQCIQEGNSLICSSIACVGGEIRLAADGKIALTLSLGGKLKNGSYIGHYIHLDESCAGRADGPIVLASGDDDRLFSLPRTAQEACR
jgi:hypothetical protein